MCVWECVPLPHAQVRPTELLMRQQDTGEEGEEPN